MSRCGSLPSAVFAGWILAAGLAGAAPMSDSGYVGRAACGECHVEQTRRWQGSHHDLAMAPAAPDTVLGDFDDATFEHFGVNTKFFRRDGGYWARTQGPDGQEGEFEVVYTFGWYPLQQYLVRFPAGRFQVLGAAWDARPESEGGGRWFHIYPDEAIPPGDLLHWTGPNQNWNHMCAECHSTNLRKQYRADGDRLDTVWSEIDVSCEACHGPGARHVAWARAGADATADGGLAVRFESSEAARWVRDAQTGRPRRVPERSSRLEVETCGRCHARRSPLVEDYRHGRSLLDTHRVALLEPELYFADGQIRDEVYVYGSFLQSRMYEKGVTCSDCHDPHSGSLRAEGNALCGRCHDSARYDVATHHHHAEGTEGAQCVSCHMPERTYMVVDPRRDHGFQIPRPDLSDRVGSPDPCTACHKARSAKWAASRVAEWRGPGRRPRAHWGEVLHAAQTAETGVEDRLLRALSDPSVPAIVRATLVGLLPRFASRESFPAFERALVDPSPLVRSAAVSALEGVDPATLVELLGPRLDDPVRLVRLEAGRVLAGAPRDVVPGAMRKRLDVVVAEYISSQEMDGDRADAHLRLGTLFLRRNELAAAEQSFERARTLDPSFLPAYVNLADLHRVKGDEARGEEVLREALTRFPNSAEARHALGLLLVRRGETEAAMVELERAAELRPDVGRYSFVLAVALNSTGQPKRALEVLRAAQARHPADPEISSFLRQLESGGAR